MRRDLDTRARSTATGLQGSPGEVANRLDVRLRTLVVWLPMVLVLATACSTPGVPAPPQATPVAAQSFVLEHQPPGEASITEPPPEMKVPHLGPDWALQSQPRGDSDRSPVVFRRGTGLEWLGGAVKLDVTQAGGLVVLSQNGDRVTVRAVSLEPAGTDS